MKLQTIFFSSILSTLAVHSPLIAQTELPNLASQVIENVSADPLVRAHDIKALQRTGGVIVLEGRVGRSDDISRIEQIAISTPGVSRVTSRLEVDPTLQTVENDPALALRVRNRIESATSGQIYQIRVSNLGSEVFLDGQVNNPVMIARLEEIARETPGVTRVENRLSMFVPPNDDRITARIKQALADSVAADIDKLDVATNHGEVTLRGDFNNHREIDHILSVALMVDGVKDIRSEMTIQGQRYDRKQ